MDIIPRKDETSLAGSFGSLRRDIDRLFDDFAFPGLSLPMLGRLVSQGRGWEGSLAMDFVEGADSYQLHAELPGLTADDIDIRLGDGLLTIKGEKTTQAEGDDLAFHLRERAHGSFQRTLSLPPGIATDAVTARFERGVLTLTLPKTAAAIAGTRKIEIAA